MSVCSVAECRTILYVTSARIGYGYETLNTIHISYSLRSLARFLAAKNDLVVQFKQQAV